MKKFVLLLALICITTSGFAQELATTYYLIRHAEKDRTDKSNKNPELTEIGKKRAIRWSEVLKFVQLDAVYSTNYKRTTQTATPTARRQGLTIQYYDPSEMYNEEFEEETKGKTVLIVGHSNTTPQFVNRVIGKQKYNDIDDSNNSNLYIITCYKNECSTQVLFIDL